uniref:THAP domain-containing protein 1 n=1 Tax=Astyanax mexicanus TaxID=7994 RepID=A0A3B1JZX9_ASTMX
PPTFHCCVPFCTASAKFNGTISFHSFPAQNDLRTQLLINIRRDHFTISAHTKVCSRHFIPDHLVDPKTPEGRRRLAKDAVPLLFQWYDYSTQAPRLSVWERRERPAEPTCLDDPPADLTMDHDYVVSAPEPSSLDMSCLTFSILQYSDAAPDSISTPLFISAVCLVPLMMRSARDSAELCPLT